MGQKDRDVLAAVIQEFITSGDPVASGRVVRSQGLAMSPSAVRNIMSRLTERGLLQQPHTSAGRVPTDQGLRMYVDQLMNVRDVTDETRLRLMTRYKLSNVELQEMLREVTRLLSEISRQCALVLVPRAELARLRRIQFVPLQPGRMLGVLVTESGMVQNRMIETDLEFSDSELEGAHRYLNELCQGVELGDLRRHVTDALEEDQIRYDALAEKALQLAAGVLQEAPAPGEERVLVEGHPRLLGQAIAPEPEQLDAVRRAVEEKKLVLRLLDQTIEADRVKVFIGSETGVEMAGYSLVASPYGGGTTLGTLGVLGPTNMDYPLVVPLVDFTADLLTEFLARG